MARRLGRSRGTATANAAIAAAVATAAAALALGLALPATGAQAPDREADILVVPTGSDAAAALQSTAARRIAGYPAFDLVEASGADAARLRAGGAVVRDDMREVRIGDESLDPTTAGGKRAARA